MLNCRHAYAHKHKREYFFLIQLVWIKHHFEFVYDGFISRSITAFLQHTCIICCCCYLVVVVCFFLPKMECTEACIKVKCSDDLAMVYLKWNLEMNVKEKERKRTVGGSSSITKLFKCP